MQKYEDLFSAPWATAPQTFRCAGQAHTKKSHATFSSCQLNNSDNVKYRKIILVCGKPTTVCYQINNISAGVQSRFCLKWSPFSLLEALWVAWDIVQPLLSYQDIKGWLRTFKRSSFSVNFLQRTSLYRICCWHPVCAQCFGKWKNVLNSPLPS